MSAKDQKTYWQNRVRKRTYQRDGTQLESKEYYAFLQWAGKRKWIPLGTSNREKAAKVAARKYVQLTEGGWVSLDKRTNASADRITIGEFLIEIEEAIQVSPRSWGNYSRSLRQIAADIKGLSCPRGAKFKWESYREWKSKVDGLPLSLLDQDSITKWTKDYLAERDNGPESVRKAKNSCNTIARNAKALFNRDLLQAANLEDLNNPFQNVRGYTPERKRYESNFDAEALLHTAREELMAEKGEEESRDTFFRRREAFKALVLFSFTAIRRKEADLLLWEQVNLQEGYIDIRRTRYFEPKSDSSVGRIGLDADAVRLLSEFRKEDLKGEFVLRGPKARKNTVHSSYRVQKTFRHLTKWLNNFQTTAGDLPFANVQKPLHEIRKEVGALLATRHGIFAAQRFLRHSDIATTERFYAAQKDKLTAGLTLAPDDKSKK